MSQESSRAVVPAQGATIDEALEQAEALIQSGHFERAELLCRELGTECARAVYALGALAFARRDLKQAVQFFGTAALLDPAVAEFSLSAARALLASGDPSRCIESAKAALVLDPSLANAHQLVGEAHRARGEYHEATAHLTRATELDPKDAVAWNGLGVCRMHGGELDAGILALQTAIGLRSDFAGAWHNLGVALENHGRSAEGLQALRRARAISPDAPSVNTAYLFALNESTELTPSEVAAEHKRWGESLVRISGEPFRSHENVPDTGRRLRVGYVSADLRGHAVAFFITPILTLHDRATVEVYCYVNQREKDITTSQLRRHADHWTEIVDHSDEAVAELIRSDAIDILVDLAGHTAGGRLGVFARQPAPVQVTYLGYPNTTGLPTVHYRITDGWADPPGETEQLHSEELVRPFESFLCYTAPAGSPEVSQSPAHGSGRITFASFNRGRKITDFMVSLWGRLLRELPDARLLLKPGPVCRTTLLHRFREHGVSSDRIDIIGYAPSILQHLDMYGSVDIALDTFPYHGATTSCEALWMGVPVITLAGRDHRSRVGVSLLRNMGLSDLIAETADDYVERALGLARDTERLHRLRAAQRDTMLRSPVMDAPGFTRALEGAYREMWARWCASPP